MRSSPICSVTNKGVSMTVKEPSVRKPRTSKATQKIAEMVLDASETIEQKRARVMRELAEVNAESPTTANVGPNYWTMGHGKLKTECVSRGILDRTGTLESMIGLLQAEDMKQGLMPHPRENEDSMTGLRANKTNVAIVPNTRDSVRVVDTDGNQHALFYRIGRNIGGQPVIMDMQANAERYVNATNGGVK
jgi:hypothetical protein